MQAKGVACISKGRFFWFVEGRVLYIYLASGNQKNRPFDIQARPFACMEL